MIFEENEKKEKKLILKSIYECKEPTISNSTLKKNNTFRDLMFSEDMI